ncbi:hypothetical protein [Lacinutrix sp. Bg11-31]|uniref:hypothetical protein n=1 Tax=Lacinutrix sp. Bg11-31 TaxID=2057808 RepID=UPI000C30312A|nr:hypothetical protein [Lacinutrix sp. Bg11-31]AUC81131.1 hypothetical protein CW733_02880 [Lacinutrix sp. Bg11-31]
MKKVGVWIDKNKAQIVKLEDGLESVKIVESNIEHFHVKGGSGSRFKGGPQDVIQDSKYLERENQQLKKYFKTIAENIKDADAIVLFGPAQTNEKFSKELQERYTTLATKLKAIKKADSMSDNEVKAWVRDFFIKH